MKDLDAIVIPTGNESDDLARTEVALKNGSRNSHYIISGIGPDMNLALEKEVRGEKIQGLNFHKRLFDFLDIVDRNKRSSIFIDRLIFI